MPVPRPATCRHRLTPPSELPHPVTLEQAGRERRQATDKMRITVFYDDRWVDGMLHFTLPASVDLLPRGHRRLVREVLVPDAVAYWEDVLTVVNRGDTIRLNRKCLNNQYFLAEGEAVQYCKEQCITTRCGEYLVPHHHLEVPH